VLAELPEGVGEEPSKEFVFWAFGAWEKTKEYEDGLDGEVHNESSPLPSAYPTPRSSGEITTRVARDDAWDILFLHLLCHSQILVLQSPWLAVYIDGGHPLPPRQSIERRQIISAKKKTEASVASMVGVVEKIFLAVDAADTRRSSPGRKPWGEHFLAFSGLLNAFEDELADALVSGTVHDAAVFGRLTRISQSLRTLSDAASTLLPIPPFFPSDVFDAGLAPAEVDTPMFLNHILSVVTMAVTQLGQIQYRFLQDAAQSLEVAKKGMGGTFIQPRAADGSSLLSAGVPWEPGLLWDDEILYSSVVTGSDRSAGSTDTEEGSSEDAEVLLALSKLYLVHCQTAMTHLRRIYISFQKFWYVDDLHFHHADKELRKLAAKVATELEALGS
ncbi:hypothetical protein HDU96_004676, partial [Phlyctochytrium bullatum]